jgi:hypothetical protein
MIMSRKQKPGWYDLQKQRHYERMARLQYGPEIVNESVRRWNSYPLAEQQAILWEGGQIYTDLAAAVAAGQPAQAAEVQAILERWRAHLRHFYEPTLDILRGLGELYRSDPDFTAFFQQFHADLPEYLHEAITQYVDDLETTELERLLAEDDLNARRSRLS